MTDEQTGAERDVAPHFDTRRERREFERHAHHRRRVLRRVVAALGTLLLVGLAGTAYAVLSLNGNITKADVSKAIGTSRPSHTAGPTGPLNLLLLGSDVRSGSGNAGYGDGSWEPGAHSDTNLLVHLSADRQSVVVVSIPRDSMTKAPVDCSPTQPTDQWEVHQWNRNYTTGGAGCVIRTIEGNTGIYIDHFAVVDFGGFKGMVDALGGVEVCTKVAIDDKASKLSLSPGRHVLTGEQALGYVRARKSLGDGSDLGRIKRQQAFLASVAQKAMSTELLLRPDKLYAFLSAATHSLTTDPEFSLGTMKDLADSVKNIGIKHIQFVTVPTEVYAPDPNRVQWAPSAELVWTALREDHAIGAAASASASGAATPSPSVVDLTVSPSAITVSVINASGTAGIARQAAEALRVQGFVIGQLGNVAAGTTRGALVEYGPGQLEAARTVAAAFPGARTSEVSTLVNTVRVTLGAGSPSVVEVPNRLGSSPLPSPTVTATVPTPSGTITARTAADDICQ